MLYFIEESDHYLTLQDEVQDSIDEQGFEPIGGVCVVPSQKSDTGFFYYQAMIQRDDVEREGE